MSMGMSFHVPEGPANRPTVRLDDLCVEYTTTQRPQGDWVVIGTVRSTATGLQRPAWVVVGTGPTADSALRDMVTELRRHSTLRRLPQPV